MKNAPFVYGKIATSPDFTGREIEIQHLTNNFENLVNTIIISPRRWGKSSLVAKVAENIDIENNNTIVVNMDLFSIKNEEEFYTTLAHQVLKSSATKWEEFAANAKKFLSQLLPQITFSPDNQNEISFGVAWETLQKRPDEILNLAEKIALDRGIKMVICIDEFQNISSFDEPLAFQKKLRAHWQKHQNTSYCLFGSKRHMLLDVFTNSSMPFYKFGDIIFLEKIPEEKWIPFIEKRFNDSGKKIAKNQAKQIAKLADNHPYYVQQLAQQVWFNIEKKCSDEDIPEAFNRITDQLSLIFSTVINSLTKPEISLLHALVNKEDHLFSQKTLKKYRLGASPNIVRLKKKLLEREIISIENDVIVIQDPLFSYWLEKRYFKQ